MIPMAIIGGLGIAGILTLSLLQWRLHSQIMAARDLLDASEKLSAQFESERDVAVMRASALEQQLQQEQKLRAIAERQRNDLAEEARKQFVEKLKGADLVDAAKFGTDMLAHPPWGMSQMPKADEPPSADGLLKVF